MVEPYKPPNHFPKNVPKGYGKFLIIYGRFDTSQIYSKTLKYCQQIDKMPQKLKEVSQH